MAAMRVLFVSGEYPAMQGGVGDYTRRLGQALCRLGVSVTVLTQQTAGGDDRRAPNSPHEPVVYPALSGGGWPLWRQVPALIRQTAPDVVHIQYQPAAYGLHPAVNYLPWRLRYLRLPALPFLPRRSPRAQPAIFTTFHDVRVPYMFPKAGPLRWRAVLALAAGSDAAVVTNPADWDQLVSADPRLVAHLRAIPIASNIRPQPPSGYDRAAQRARWGTGPDDWLLAYFGFLNVGKGGETLMRGLGHLVAGGRPARLLMVGGQVGSSDPTNQAYLAHVQDLIRSEGLQDRVSWTGFTTDEEVSANLLAADCAVLPYRTGASLRHGSLMAALAHGLPVITTAAPAEQAVSAEAQRAFPQLQHGESVFRITADDPAALAGAVTQVMTDSALRARLAAGALALAAVFDWDAIARRHLEVYQTGVVKQQR